MIVPASMYHLIRIFGSGLGLGFVPKLPGTAGTLLGVVLFYFLSFLQPWQFFVTLFGFSLFAIWISDRAAAYSQNTDPQWVVIDEIVGVLFALALFAPTWPHLLGGFLLFRFFDMVKMGPVRWAEKLPGGWGIVIDDLVAGILANLVLRGIVWFL